MKISKKFVKSPYFWLFVLAVANLFVALFFVRYPLQLNGDSPSYLGAMQIIQGKEYDHNLYGAETDLMLKTRILTTPLMLYASILAGKVLGSEYSGMFFVNLIFYFLIIYVFYELVKIIYNSNKVAFLASILFFTNYCFVNYGATYRTDIGGWFFFLLATLLAVKYFKDPEKKKFFFFSILASSIGVLFKEYGALGLIPLGILILFLPLTWGKRVKKLVETAALFWIIPILYYIFIYFKFGFSYIDRYLYAVDATIKSADAGINWSVILLIKVLGWLFLAGWPIFIFGLYQEYKNFDAKRFKILLAILPASLAFLAWPGLIQRIAFIFVPFLAMISAFGLSKLKNKYFVIFILIVYVAVGYLTRNAFLSWDLLKIVNF